MMMPEFLERELVAGNTGLNLIVFFSVLVITMIVGKVVQALLRGRIKKRAEQSETKLDDVVLTTFERPLYWVLFVIGFSFAFRTLELPEQGGAVIHNVTTVLVTVFVAWSASNFLTSVRAVYVDPMIEKSDTKLDDQIVPIFERSLKVTIWVVAVLVVLSNMSVDIVSLLAGLGIGGLALAMAAQDTLSNVFGSVTIFADRPFQVDDIVTIGDHTGTITEVGLRTCRLRTFDDTLVTVPNKILVGEMVQNLTSRPARRSLSTIGLVYDTSCDELEAAMQAIRDILSADERVQDGATVRLSSFGDSALELTVIYWIVPPSEYFDATHDINLAIKRAFDSNSWDMAFPSMTIYRPTQLAPQG